MLERVIPYKVIQVLLYFVTIFLALAFLLTSISASTRPCDINNFTQSLTRMYLNTETKGQYHLLGAKSSWKSYNFGFACFWRSPDHLFFQMFFHGVRHLKVRKLADSGFWKKVQMSSESSIYPKNEVFRF